MTAARASARQAFYVRLGNRIGDLLAGAGLALPRIDAGGLQARARRATGLEDFGDPACAAGLEAVVDSLNAQAGLSQAGRVAAWLNLLSLLRIRLRLIDYRARNPAVARERIEAPLFITGLPRTGTTILHELLAQDPAVRSPASWEVTRPLPPPEEGSYSRDGRVRSVGRLLALAEDLAPGLQAIHALGARLPQECVYILASAFASEQFGYMYNVPRYRAWLLEQDMGHAYRWHAHFLQHLQVHYRRERWVLKTPAHLASLEALFAQYPDACVVWTHRRPLQAIASFSSLAHTLRGGFSDSIDPLAIGPREMAHFSAVAAAGMRDRADIGAERILDVGFDAICTRPLSVIDEIYDHFDLPLDDGTRRRMRDYLARRPRDLYGVHRYAAGDYGLDAAHEGEYFGDYLTRFAGYC